MRFSYYDRLSARDQATYRRSDEIASIALPGPESLHPFVGLLREALARDDRKAVGAAAARLAQGILILLGAPAVHIEVLAVRPVSRDAELHGLYTNPDGQRPRIRVWMRTAHHGRVVAFKSFLRTLLHELGHHLDYTYLKLPESFHTEGFFKRESSLFKQLVPSASGPPPPVRA